MNIYLIPYTWLRHFQFAFWSSICGLVVWWLYLSWLLLVGPFWPASWDTIFTGMFLSGGIAVSNVLGEAGLQRWSFKKRLLKSMMCMGVAIGSSLLLFWLWRLISTWLFSNIGNDHHVVALKFKLGYFIVAGFVCSLSVLSVRKWEGKVYIINHFLAGLMAGVSAAAIWSISAYYFVQNLYWAGALMFVSFGFFFGLCAWPIPSRLYIGWLRVLNGKRFGQRIPIDARDDRAKERFVGHYPNGLDLYLSGKEGVRELHISVLHQPDQDLYSLRGLSLKHTKMKRFLEWALLDYNPKSPVPREVQLHNEDRIELGQSSEVEFLILPREER
jgi:hypothetical protein